MVDKEDNLRKAINDHLKQFARLHDECIGAMYRMAEAAIEAGKELCELTEICKQNGIEVTSTVEEYMARIGKPLKYNTCRRYTRLYLLTRNDPKLKDKVIALGVSGGDAYLRKLKHTGPVDDGDDDNKEKRQRSGGDGAHRETDDDDDESEDEGKSNILEDRREAVKLSELNQQIWGMLRDYFTELEDALGSEAAFEEYLVTELNEDQQLFIGGLLLDDDGLGLPLPKTLADLIERSPQADGFYEHPDDVKDGNLT